MILNYKHHGNEVFVEADLKGKNREHCLCYKCDRFVPGTDKNCQIAQDTYENCVRWGLVTPVYECPSFVEQIDPFELLQAIKYIADGEVDASSPMYMYLRKLKIYLENHK